MADPLAHPEELIGRVYAYVAYRLGDGPDAEDVTSDVFERALRYRDTYRRGDGKPIQWLIGIARRSIADHSTRAARAPVPEPIDGGPAAGGDPLAEVATRLDLRAALAELDEREQELLALRYGADLTARQIGDLLHMRTNTVEVALHRALTRLRETLDR